MTHEQWKKIILNYTKEGLTKTRMAKLEGVNRGTIHFHCRKISRVEMSMAKRFRNNYVKGLIN